MSDWEDCKISKISFKIAKCQQQGFDYKCVREQIPIVKAEKAAEKAKKDAQVQEFLKKSDLAIKDQTWLIEKHTGEKFIQYNKKDGKYEAYRVGSTNIIDSGDWYINIDETTYHEKTDGKWRGKIR